MNNNELNPEVKPNPEVQPNEMQNMQPQQPVEGQNLQPELNQMNQQETKKQAFEKSQKMLKIDLLIIGIIYVIATIFTIITQISAIKILGDFEGIGYGKNGLIISAVIRGAQMIGMTVFVFIGYSLAKQGKKSAGVIGMVVGILMILTILSGDILDFVIGIALVINSNDYLKKIKENDIAI